MSNFYSQSRSIANFLASSRSCPSQPTNSCNSSYPGTVLASTRYGPSSASSSQAATIPSSQPRRWWAALLQITTWPHNQEYNKFNTLTFLLSWEEITLAVPIMCSIEGSALTRLESSTNHVRFRQPYALRVNKHSHSLANFKCSCWEKGWSIGSWQVQFQRWRSAWISSMSSIQIVIKSWSSGIENPSFPRPSKATSSTSAEESNSPP